MKYEYVGIEDIHGRRAQGGLRWSSSILNVFHHLEWLDGREGLLTEGEQLVENDTE